MIAAVPSYLSNLLSCLNGPRTVVLHVVCMCDCIVCNTLYEREAIITYNYKTYRKTWFFLSRCFPNSIILYWVHLRLHEAGISAGLLRFKSLHLLSCLKGQAVMYLCLFSVCKCMHDYIVAILSNIIGAPETVIQILLLGTSETAQWTPPFQISASLQSRSVNSTLAFKENPAVSSQQISFDIFLGSQNWVCSYFDFAEWYSKKKDSCSV